MYDCTLVVPLVLRWKGHLPEGKRYSDYCQLKDLTPTLLDLMGIDTGLPFDGRSLMPLVRGEHREAEPEFTSPSAPGCASTAGGLPNGS